MLYFPKHGAYQQSKSSVVDHTGPYQLLTKHEVKILDIGWVLFCVFKDQDGVGVHKLAKRRQYPAILTKKAWSIKNLLFG